MTESKVRYQFLPWTPEGKAERAIQAERELWEQDRADSERRRQEAEDRLDAPVTRRELLAALGIAYDNARTWNDVRDAIKALIKELE